MDIAITTLSLGVNYTRDYSLKLINDVLNRTEHKIYLTTDCASIIEEAYPNNPRVVINKITREKLLIRLNVDGGVGYATDFNFNMRYMCLEPVKNLKNTVVVFTDCDNSLDWWDEDVIQNWLDRMKKTDFDFFAPRADYKLWQYLDEYNKNKDINPRGGIFWHKILNFDLINNPKPEWNDASLPAEYILVFMGDTEKLEKFYNQWKNMHDYLVNQGWTYGTWAEGFEIGVSALVAGYESYDIGWSHEIWGKAFTPNGYKKIIWHPTES